MRKQTKWAVILGAAAVMTFGACMTSFAATGWVQEDSTWYYYDKDEEAVTDTWKKGADGKQYYLGDDGAMVTSSWVDGDKKYYVDANGSRVTNSWRLMFGVDDDADEESWFWFKSTGEMAFSTKVVVNNKTYYFDADGKMLTGWINTKEYVEADVVSADAVFSKEDGTRLTGWAQLEAPEDEDEEDTYWYYFDSKGVPSVAKKKVISSKSYLFDQDGKMISGWAIASQDNADKTVYISIEEDDTVANYNDLLYCGNSNDGVLKKKAWVKTTAPGKDVEDLDEDRNWYYFGDNGFLFTASSLSAQVKGASYAQSGDKLPKSAELANPLLIGLAKSTNSKIYGFKDNGIMIKGLWAFLASGTDDFNAGTYYFGGSDDGAMKIGSVSITNDDGDSYSYYFASKPADGYTKGEGWTGVQSSKLYCNGLIFKAEEGTNYALAPIKFIDENEKVVGISYYIVNESGKVMSGVNQAFKMDSGYKLKNVAKHDYGYDIVLLDSNNKEVGSYKSIKVEVAADNFSAELDIEDIAQ
jgi:glucan-binding YG repeat protein